MPQTFPTIDDQADGDGFRMLQLSSLPDSHRLIISRALRNVLNTGLAEDTFAQIVDGLPTSVVEQDSYSGSVHRHHPLHKEHIELCDGSLKRTIEFRNGLDYDILMFELRLIHTFAGASPGSRIFQALLIELIAVAIHQLAAGLYDLNTNSGAHANDGLAAWTPSKDDELWWEFHPDGAPPTLFRHLWYCDYDRYPRGVSDGVGYWAESRILGGVVLFDRGGSGAFPDADPTAVYFHSDRHEITYRIYKLLDTQKQALMEFLLSEDETIESPLPILADSNNRTRVDPEEPLEATGIYRDLWERKPLGPDDADRRLRDVFDFLDWPTEEDWLASNGRGYDMRYAFRYGDREWSD